MPWYTGIGKVADTFSFLSIFELGGMFLADVKNPESVLTFDLDNYPGKNHRHIRQELEREGYKVQWITHEGKNRVSFKVKKRT